MVTDSQALKALQYSDYYWTEAGILKSVFVHEFWTTQYLIFEQGMWCVNRAGLGYLLV